MAEIDMLRERVERFVNNGARTDDLRSLLKQCIEDGSLDALVCVRRLYEDMYGGFTFNIDLKAPAASTLLVWREAGLRALVEAAHKNPTSKNVSIVFQLLATVASGAGLPMFGEVDEPSVDAAIRKAINDTPNLASLARSYLVDFILSFPNDDELSLYVGNALTLFSFDRGSAARELFAAVSKRWLAVNTPVLNEFRDLIESKPHDEPSFQKFLTKHPQILDPLALRVWPQPDIFGFREPDFVIQRADGTYLIVELECPKKLLITASGHLSADVTHAEKQATDYRRYIFQKFSEVEKHFPQFQEPDCLVVVGVERALSVEQRQALQDANQNRKNVRIVGFDWLLERSKTIAGNLIQSDIEIIPLRIV